MRGASSRPASPGAARTCNEESEIQSLAWAAENDTRADCERTVDPKFWPEINMALDSEAKRLGLDVEDNDGRL